MNSFCPLLASLLVIVQFSQASYSYGSYPYGSYHEGYPALTRYYSLADPYSYAPFAYGAYPYGYSHGLHSHHYHPRVALRNVAKSFHRENGHLSETDMISSFAKKN